GQVPHPLVTFSAHVRSISLMSIVANYSRKEAPAGQGDWAGASMFGTATQQYKHSRHHPSRLRIVSRATYAAAAKRTFGEPTTPPFSIAAFISSEANHARAFPTSAT